MVLDAPEAPEPRNRRRTLGIAVALWDAGWKAAAVRVAVRNRQWKWAAALFLISSAGVLPMVYLAKFARPQSQAPGDAALRTD